MRVFVRGLRMSLTIVGRAAASPRGAGLAALTAALLLGACSEPVLMSNLAPPLAQEKKKGDVDLTPLAAAFKADPADVPAALAYARALRSKGARSQALAVLGEAAKAKPDDRRLALQRGLLALELGDPARAEPLLRAAHDAKAPDWRLHSALGTALASRGKQREAREQFAMALALAPNHPSILNNLALAYALDGKAEDAEKVLRKAVPAGKSTPNAEKLQQNLALVLALGGKYSEARATAEAALPAAKAGENVAYVQKLAHARSAGWAAKTEPAEAR